MAVNLGRIGVWSGQLRRGDPERTRDAVPELESLGYGAVWMPGGAAGTFFELAGDLLASTTHLVVASGILSVWTNPAADVARGTAALEARTPDRFLLGLGVSHPHIVERQTAQRFEHPVAVMRRYLDDLARSDAPVARDRLALAALGPRMLELSRDRTWGAHPYLVPPEHTRIARFVLGQGRLLAPEQAVVLETDPGRARAIARRHLSTYLQASNYVNNWRRLGFGPDDVEGDGSDRLVDALVAWGDLDAIRARVDAHFAAGADHVCLQALEEDAAVLPMASWRRLAELARG